MLFRCVADALMFHTAHRLTSERDAAALERQRQAQTYRPENTFHRDQIQSRNTDTRKFR
jgi:hypothetical protein